MTSIFAWICAGIAALATLGAAYFFDKSAEEGISKAEEAAAHANRLAAEAHERAATLEKDAADARLETERLKASVAWRELSGHNFVALTENLKRLPGGKVLSIEKDPEIEALAIRFSQIFNAAEWKIYGGTVSLLSNKVAYGIIIPDTPNSTELRAAFKAADIPFSAEKLPWFQMTSPPFNKLSEKEEELVPVVFIGARPLPAPVTFDHRPQLIIVDPKP